MITFLHQTSLKAGAIQLYLLCALLGDALFPVSFTNTPIAHATTQTQQSFSQGFPVARNVTIIPSQIPTKTASQKAMAIIPKAAPKKMVAYLKIPSIKVNAVIKDMGVTSKGAMAVPGNSLEVGLYSLGTRPGETGSAVIGGHNEWAKAPGVFARLDQVKIGDVVSVVDAKGVSTHFIVREMRTYQATEDGSDIFLSMSGVHLNLITCSGVWNPATNSYTTRLVIFTDLQKT